MEKTQSGIYVRFFGKFCINYNGKQMFLGRNKASKAVRLFQMLIVYQDTGISREQLIEQLFAGDGVSDYANSLRVSAYRMKKMLIDFGLPKEEYCISKDGIYRWNPDIPVQTDIGFFQQYLEKAKEETDQREKTKWLCKACEFYEGEFLEELGVEEWSIIQAVRYKQLYEGALKMLCSLLREQRQYETMLAAVDRAARLYPYDEWQVEKIECLNALNRKKEAYDLYFDTARMYQEELQIDMPAEMRQQISHLSHEYKSQEQMAMEIMAQLETPEEEKGANYLSTPSFRATYQFSLKNGKRTEQPVCLLACTLESLKEEIFENPKELEAAAQILHTTIRDVLRQSDSFTRYSDCQYLILLVGAKREQCDVIFERIRKLFLKKYKLEDYDLSYDIISASEDDE